MASKGPPFERQVCHALSLWWTDGKDDSWFWRTSQSGGRATTRARKGKATRGHAGDICATCPEAQPLLDLVAIEVKRGYASATPFDLLDRGKKTKPTYEEWIRQASRSAEQSGAPYWMIIHRRDSRAATVTLPSPLASVVFGVEHVAGSRSPLIQCEMTVSVGATLESIETYLFEDLLKSDPGRVLDELGRLKKVRA